MSYKIRYSVKFERGEFETTDLVDHHDQGLTDALLVHSVIFSEQGARSEAIATMDGRTGKDIPAIDLYKSWNALAHHLMTLEGLPPGLKAIARMAFTNTQSTLRNALHEDNSPHKETK